MASSPATAQPAKTSSSPPSSISAANANAGSRQRAAPNGVSNRPKSRNEPKPAQNTTPSREANGQDRHAHDRLLFLVATFVGQTATITTKSGEQFSGVFSAASLESAESSYVLKMTKRVGHAAPQQSNGVVDPLEDYVGSGDDHAMVFDVKEVADLFVPNVSTDKVQAKMPNGIAGSFKTDTDISGNLAMRERELQAWLPSADTDVDLTLNGSGGTWDQFETNERLYGVRTNYDENFYTTAIDRSHPSYRQRAAAADRLAREIEGTATTNVHVAEERGLVAQSEEDEEARFSGVRREFPPLPASQGNKYTPPARRAPTGQPTVTGAPVDPAIISSQLARPEASRSQSSSAKKENEEPATSSPSGAQTAVPLTAIESPSDAKSAPAKDPPPPKPLATNIPPSSVLTPPSTAKAASNSTNSVENEVLDSFKSFAANEKLKYQERARTMMKKEKEVKLNDLKKFSMNFKLKTAVPTDMLGILAKDPHKQEEIAEKSQRQLEEQQTNVRTGSVSSEQQTPKPASAPRADNAQTSPTASVDRPILPKNNRAPPPQTFHTVRGDRPMQNQHVPMLSPRAGPGNLGPRLMAQYQHQQQFRDRTGQGFPPAAVPDPRAIPTGPAAINTDVTQSRLAGAQTPSSSVSSRFNVQAMEFRPNPTAITFQPSGEQSTGTSSPARPPTASRQINQTSFFGDSKPKPASERRSIRDAFNPFKRLKKEAGDKAQKEFASNGGIPQAYRTAPLWEPPEQNKNKGWKDMFEKIPTGPSAMPGNAMPHHHQLPAHLQNGPHQIPPGHSPHQSHHTQPHFGHVQNRDPHFDEHRMHPSSSNSSVFPSPTPRFQQPMLAYQNPMMGQMQPGFGQPPYQMGPNGQPVGHIRQYGGGGTFANAQGLMATPMMANNSTGGNSYGAMHMGQMPMYSPSPGHVLPAHVAPHTPGQPGMPSPQRAPMMTHQNSQQAHASGGYVYMSPGQHPGQMYAQQQQLGPMPQMRGGFPMVNQHSYGSSPHMQHAFPPQQRGMQFGGQFATQHMHPSQMMIQAQNAGAHVGQGGDHET